jgi:hypothetical protein
MKSWVVWTSANTAWRPIPNSFPPRRSELQQHSTSPAALATGDDHAPLLRQKLSRQQGQQRLGSENVNSFSYRGVTPLDTDPLSASALNTDRWFYGVFQSAPDLIRWLAVSPSGAMPSGAVPTELDRQYRFSAPELKAGSHRLDGVLWPIGSETGSEDLPVVLLEVQMRADISFHHRLAAQTYRFLQLHPRIERWRVVVITPHRRLQLGPVLPLRGFLEQVNWISLEELGQQENLDAAVDLLTLPVRSEQELAERCRRILANRRDLDPVVFSMLF